jgi:hypothetical protein
VGLAVERTRLHTLRGVIRFAVQALGLSLILFILFGLPDQMSTILGLAGAGLTVACKDFIMGFIGWFLLMGRNGLRVGDWVDIDGVVGEVVEIGLLRTVLLETGNWTDSGHPTGRKVALVNSFAIEGHFFNFSTTGQWLWDEVEILVPASQNPYPIIDAIQKMVTDQSQANVLAAEWQRATSRYRAQPVSAAPACQPASDQGWNRGARAIHHAGGRAACHENSFVPGPGGIAARAPARSGCGGQRIGRALETGLRRLTASFRDILQQTLFSSRRKVRAVQNVQHQGRRQRLRELHCPAPWRLFIAQQGNTDFPPWRPLRMAADYAYECGRRVAPHQRPDDSGFSQTGIFQRGMNHPRFRIEQDGGGYTSGRPTRQREPLPLRESLQPVDERFLGCHFDIGRNHRGKRHLHKVESEQVPHQGNGDVSRRSGMLDQGQLYLAAFHDAAVPAQAIDQMGGQIALLQKDQGKIFGKRRVRCRFGQHFRRRAADGFVQRSSESFGNGCTAGRN